MRKNNEINKKVGQKKALDEVVLIVNPCGSLLSALLTFYSKSTFKYHFKFIL